MEIMETQVRKVQNCRNSGGCFFGKFKSKIKLAKCCRGFSPRSVYKILNEGQGQGLWETLASMTYPQLLLIWLKIPIRKTATMTKMSSKM
jgi:hypothetical protein